ncbi:MAG: hypothetical protein H8E37_02510 [Planctomycetes bacterium]|nr:hypothetical protein [Planctomycetota bacterium]
MSTEVPAPRLEHLERVVINGNGTGYHGERGTIVWLESSAVRRNPTRPDQWAYVVHLPKQAAWRTFLQSDLESEGGFDLETDHLGKRAEISFDLVLKEDNDWMEGSYRLLGEFWNVVIFRKDDVEEVRFQRRIWERPTKWERAMTGMVIRFPRKVRVGRNDLFGAMSRAFGCSEWTEVAGPDSMVLR